MDFFHRPEDPAVGYWGKRTSAVDWCENNYTWSFYIAEFFNTITSLPAAFLALYSIYLTYKYGYDKRFYLINFLVGMVGLGSAAFHGTLLYTGQIFDELPMVYTCTAILYAVLEMESKKEAVNKHLGPMLIGFSVIFTAVYLYLPSFFIFFLIGFIGGILTLVYQCALIFKKSSTLYHQKVFILTSVGFYIGGWLCFWVPEILFCDQVQSFNFHSLWHVTSTLGCFTMVLFTTFQREMHRGRNPQLDYNCILGVPLIPFVNIPNQNSADIKISPLLNKKSDISNDTSSNANNSDNDEHEQIRKKLFKKKSSISSFR